MCFENECELTERIQQRKREGKRGSIGLYMPKVGVSEFRISYQKRERERERERERVGNECLIVWLLAELKRMRENVNKKRETK